MSAHLDIACAAEDAREARRANKRLPDEVRRARELLWKKGYSYRSAQGPLGVCFVHLAKVLTGKRKSVSLLRAIEELPDSNSGKGGAR